LGTFRASGPDGLVAILGDDPSTGGIFVMTRKLAASLFVTALIAAGCTVQGQVGSPPAAPTAPAPTPVPTPTPTPVATPAATTPVTPPTTPTSTVKQEGNKLKMPGAIVFETGKAALKPESEPVLDQLKIFLDGKRHITLTRIEGHTDNVGGAPANLKLSGDRAQAVRNWLINKGIDSKRLIAVGFGDTKPIADNSKDEGRSQNRRTEFVVVETDNKPWMGADPVGGGTVFGDNPRAK
jgi:OOP family OmpA-OmpF porin